MTKTLLIKTFDRLIGLMLIVVLLGPVVWAEDRPLIKEVTVQGNQNTTMELILSVVKAKAGEQLSLPQINRDLKAIYALGTFTDVAVDEQRIEGGVRITFQVKEKPFIGKIKFTSNREYKEKELLESIRMSENHPFDEKVLREAVNSLKQFYADKSYTLAAITASKEFLPDENKVNITFDIQEGNRVKIRKISITGTRVYSEQTIKNQMDTKEVDWLGGGGVYKEEILATDLEKIRQFYQNEGYAKVRITSHEATLDNDKRSYTLRIGVEEGPQFKVGKVGVRDNTLFPADQMLMHIESKEGKVYGRKRLEDDLATLRMMYYEKGYIYAQIVPLTQFRDAEGAVDITFAVQEGRIAYVEKVEFEGNNRTKRKVLEREVRNLIRPGDVFDAVKIQRGREKLYNLGFFEEVGFDTNPGSEKGKEVLVYTVKERLTGTLSLGVGYSSVDNFLGFVEVSEINLFGNAQRISLSTQIGQRRLDYRLGFYEPWLFDQPVSLSLDLYDTRRRLENYFYTEERIGGAIGLGRRWTDTLSTGITYKYENVRISDVDVLAIGVKDGQQQTLSSLILTNTYDDRDNIFDASRGSMLSLSNQLAGSFLGGDNHFTKHIVDMSQFFPSIWKQALGLRLRLGYGSGFDPTPEMPIYEKFYMGGTDTVRGYNERDIGPMNIYGVPLGGNAMALFNAEYKIPLIQNLLKWVFFYDSGDVWPGVSEALKEPFPYPDSLGTGFRITIPGMVIVVRIDYGWGLRDPLRVPGGKFHFNIGSIF